MTFSAPRPALEQADGSLTTRGCALDPHKDGETSYSVVHALNLRVCATDTRRGAGGSLPHSSGARGAGSGDSGMRWEWMWSPGEHGEASRGVPHGALRNDDGYGLHGHREARSGQRGKKTPGAQGEVGVGTWES